MTVRREQTATGSAMSSLHMEPGRFLYDDGHTTNCPTGVRKTQGVRRVGGRAATSQDAGSYSKQGHREDEQLITSLLQSTIAIVSILATDI